MIAEVSRGKTYARIEGDLQGTHEGTMVNKKEIKLRIEPETHERLKAIADQLGLDLAPMILRAAVEKYLGATSEQESYNQLIQELTIRLDRLQKQVDDHEGALRVLTANGNGKIISPLSVPSETLVNSEATSPQIIETVKSDEAVQSPQSTLEAPLKTEQLLRDELMERYNLDSGSYSALVTQTREQGYAEIQGTHWGRSGKGKLALWTRLDTQDHTPD